jgi:hypothetical protein
MNLAPALGALAIVSLAGEPTATTPDADRPVTAHLKPELAQALYRSQLLGELDHPVGDQLAIGGLTILARLDAKGDLELDLKGDGKFKAFSQPSTIPLTIPTAGDKHGFKLSIHVSRGADKAWVYRNVTQLTLQLGPETLVFVDVNGNGVYDEPGIDGMTWGGNEWLFPLPAADERWCTPTFDFTGLSFGPLGEEPKLSARPLATTVPEALGVLQGVNRERIKLGLTPRPENTRLSADLQLHCHYMALDKKLEHGEDKGKPGYTPAGAAAGPRSILSQGWGPDGIASGMVHTLYHRQDVIRPQTRGFGVGFDAGFGGIDGRSDLGSAPASWWPVLCPVPDQRDIPLDYAKEGPDATPGDDHAGYPITAYFGTSNLELSSYTLKAVAGGKNPAPLDCYTYDSKHDPAGMAGWQGCVALIAKDPLEAGATYEVTMAAQVAGKPWTRTWRFATVGAPAKPKR